MWVKIVFQIINYHVNNNTTYNILIQTLTVFIDKIIIFILLQNIDNFARLDNHVFGAKRLHIIPLLDHNDLLEYEEYNYRNIILKEYLSK